MNEMNVSLPCVAAGAGCTVGVCLITLACFGVLPYPFASLGVVTNMLTCMIVLRHWLTLMGQRERSAFDLGRESVRLLR